MSRVYMVQIQIVEEIGYYQKRETTITTCFFADNEEELDTKVNALYKSMMTGYKIIE